MNQTYTRLRQQIDAAAQRCGHHVRLLAVSKTQSADAIRALTECGQVEFGENYVREALAKQALLTELNLQWHMIGPLQSNKCADVARNFSWLQSLDREKLIAALNRNRPESLSPLNVLIQVNIDDEASKSGCAPQAIQPLAQAIAQAPRLRLRGLMAIPAPGPDVASRRGAFERMRVLFETLRNQYPHVDTLSMGMSADFELAIGNGATMVRIGSALFGPRNTTQPIQRQ